MACSKNVMVVGLLGGKTLNLTVDGPLCVGQVKEYFRERECVEWSLFSLTRGGVVCADQDTVGDSDVTVLHAHPLIKGGKGGFGSLIRAMGSQINKSTNKEACRNLSGRRVRDINAEKKIAKWASGEAERKKKEEEEKRQRLERKRAGPRHDFDDAGYMEQIKSTEEEMGGALKQGLEASSSKGKSKAVEVDRPSKRPKLWLGVDEELSDSEDEEEQHTADQVVGGSPCSLDGADGTSDAGPSSSYTLKDSPRDEATPTSNTPVTVGDGKELTEKEEKKDLVDKEDDCTVEDAGQSGYEPIDLDAYESAEELVGVGGERLKMALQSLGLKCGGTVMQRAARLYSTKGKTKEQYDTSLFVKPKKSKIKQKSAN